MVTDGAGRLRGRTEPHAADRWRRRLICRPDRGPVPAPYQRGGIQPRLAQESAAGGAKIRRTGRTRGARAFCRNSFRKMKSPNRLIRPLVRELHPYVYGEQPKIKGLIKLNTNENAYPPSPKVLAAIKAAVDGRLRLYPNPMAQPLREKLSRLHRCAPENIIVGNGSDELLAMAVRCFVEPASPGVRRSRTLVQLFNPSYSLYPVLAEIHGARTNAIPLEPDFGLPPLASLKRERDWEFRAALTFVTTPN